MGWTAPRQLVFRPKNVVCTFPYTDTWKSVKLLEPKSSGTIAEKLATELFQASYQLKTSTNEYIKEAIIHFRQLKMTKSANLFLKS
jgi:hypothetical protein